MLLNTCLRVIVVIVYGFLLSKLFLPMTSCPGEKPCIKFCCDNQSSCEQISQTSKGHFGFEREHMFPSSIPETNLDDAYFFTEDYDILTGYPSCPYTSHYGYLDIDMVRQLSVNSEKNETDNEFSVWFGETQWNQLLHRGLLLR